MGVHSFFFIRTSNFDAEAERSYIFWRFEAETFLKMFLNLPGIVFQPISADVTRQTIKEHFLLRYGIKLLAHTGLTCSDATCEMSRQPTLAKFGFKKRIDHRGLQQDINLWQPVDAGYAQILKVLIGQAQRKWLDDEENAEKWYGHESSFSAKERRILITHWVGEAYKKLAGSEYDNLRLRVWQKTGCLMTADILNLLSA